jgi:hypothetical protein
MATISMFYGIIISMMYMDNKQHTLPHIHADYQGESVVLSIPDGDILAGDINLKKLKLIRAWIEIHNEALLADLELAVSGKTIFTIDPLR